MLKRIWHPYTKWEEVKYGMWDSVNSITYSKMIKKAIAFTGDFKIYGAWMQNVIRSWYYSCEHNLTDIGQNRKAWIGHAACCMALGIPEHITREAWSCLSKKQQEDANKQAEKAILDWEKINAPENFKLCQ